MNCKITSVTDNNFQAKDLLYIHSRVYETAIKSGINVMNRNTHYHPINMSGALIWSEIVGVFRRIVVQNNPTWQTKFQNGLSMLVNSEINCSLVISSGNPNTGIAEKNPSTINGKGSATYDYVEHNYELWDIKDEECADTHRTYVLLYYVDRIEKHIRYELSLPINTRLIGKKSKIYIYQWKTRVIFDPIPTHKEAIVTVNRPNFMRK